MSNQSYQDLYVKLEGMQQAINIMANQIASTAHALTWLMTRMQHAVPSPIHGAPPTVKTFLQMYQDDLAKLIAAHTPPPGESNDEDSPTERVIYTPDEHDGPSSGSVGS